MSDDEILAVLANCSFCEWEPFTLGHLTIDGRPVVECHTGPNENSRRPGVMTTGGGCGIAFTATDEESVVRAAFDSVLQHTAHEVAEFFTYRDERVFDPHALLAAD